MSTHRIDVVRINAIDKHPNADALGLVSILGFTCAVRLGDFAPGDLAVYVEPDYVVPCEGPFAFLCGDGKPARIKAKRLRGVWSQGLLVRAPEGAAEGDDVMGSLGIVRYEPAMEVSSGGDAESPHESLGSVPKYDLENWRRYRHLLVDGEEVVVTEKIHGANARFAFRDGRMWCGSRTQWKREDPSSIWWRALAASPWLAAYCEACPEVVVYGEVFGQVQDLKYGATPGQVMFRVFDVLCRIPGEAPHWADADVVEMAFAREQRVPVVYRGAYSAQRMEELAVADSTIAKHLAEGVVIKPVRERTDLHLGRVALKLVSNRYLERA